MSGLRSFVDDVLLKDLSRSDFNVLLNRHFPSSGHLSDCKSPLNFLDSLYSHGGMDSIKELFSAIKESPYLPLENNVIYSNLVISDVLMGFSVFLRDKLLDKSSSSNSVYIDNFHEMISLVESSGVLRFQDVHPFCNGACASDIMEAGDIGLLKSIMKYWDKKTAFIFMLNNDGLFFPIKNGDIQFHKKLFEQLDSFEIKELKGPAFNKSITDAWLDINNRSSLSISEIETSELTDIFKILSKKMNTSSIYQVKHFISAGKLPIISEGITFLAAQLKERGVVLTKSDYKSIFSSMEMMLKATGDNWEPFVYNKSMADNIKSNISLLLDGLEPSDIGKTSKNIAHLLTTISDDGKWMKGLNKEDKKSILYNDLGL